MAKILITRSNEWTNRRRKFQLELDGTKLGPIKNDEVLEFEVTPGQHSLIAKMDWLSSNAYEINIGVNENRYLRISGFKYSNVIFTIIPIVILAYMLVVGKVMRMENERADYVLWGIVGTYLLIVIYCMTLGRKRYLWLREDIK